MWRDLSLCEEANAGMDVAVKAIFSHVATAVVDAAVAAGNFVATTDVLMESLQSVWPYWAIFEITLLQIALQKYAKY